MKSKAYNAGIRAASEGFTGTNPYDTDLAAEWAEGFAAGQKKIAETVDGVMRVAAEGLHECPFCGSADLGEYTRHTDVETMEFAECYCCEASAPSDIWNARQGYLVEALADIYSTTTDGATALKAKAALVKAGVK